ncbi:zinc finger BED domain-containing protein 5-like [Palaemon carinicauda]|uniref:zinc finger BED domain-containing protein 5-like n=1 Tax=Palaemon carinicauda TaxID=392227 RepID=UPI0035B6045F
MGEDIFETVSSFFEKVGLSWADGSPAMLGCWFGLQARVKEANPRANKMHCMIPDLKTVLDDVVAMIDFIKKNPLNTRLLRLLYQELNADEESLLFHTEIRWLSRGNIVTRVVTLKGELKEFLERNQKEKTRKLRF